MIKARSTAFVTGLLLVELSCTDFASAKDRVDQNVAIMREAARKLELSSEGDGHAYLLVKQEIVRAPVAVIFGYVDNAEACEEIADVLSNAPRAGTFKCSPID